MADDTVRASAQIVTWELTGSAVNLLALRDEIAAAAPAWSVRRQSSWPHRRSPSPEQRGVGRSHRLHRGRERRDGASHLIDAARARGSIKKLEKKSPPTAGRVPKVELAPLRLSSGLFRRAPGPSHLSADMQEPLLAGDDRSVAFWDARLPHHEVGHWRRILGTTFGHFILLQRLARDRTLWTAFGELTPEQLSAVKRTQSAREAHLERRAALQPEVGGRVFRLDGQFWGEMMLATDGLMDGLTRWVDTSTRDEVLRLSVADTWSHGGRQPASEVQLRHTRTVISPPGVGWSGLAKTRHTQRRSRTTAPVCGSATRTT